MDGQGVMNESLIHETQLQKALADEKMRSEQHKINYQTLKAEHSKLQQEFFQLQEELKTTIQESKEVGDNYKDLLNEVRKELLAKHNECEELKALTLTDQKKELLQLEIAEDLESSFRQKFNLVTAESEQYRTELNKVKYELSFLKAEYEHVQLEHKQVLNEMKMRHEAEVSNLRQEREAVMSKQQSDVDQEMQKIRVTQRENAQLHLKVKGLLDELEEIRAQREHSGLQSDHVTRMQAKQLAEHASNVKALETERSSLKLQVESLQRELSNTTELHTTLTSKTHDLEKENIVLRNRADEVLHKSKVDMADLRKEMMRERSELERQRNKYMNDVEELRSQIELLQHEIDQQSNSLIEKERESVKRVQAAREEEWQKHHLVENEKLELETRIQELEHRKMDADSRLEAEREKCREQVKAAHDAKEQTERELLVISQLTKLQHNESVLDQLDRERSENSELRDKLHRIETEYGSYVSNENELLDMNAQLKNQVETYKEEMRRTKEEVARGRTQRDSMIAESKMAAMENRMQLERRVEELESNLSHAQVKYATAVNEHKKKKKKYMRIADNLQNKLQLCRAKCEEYKIERDTLKKSVPPEAHLKLKKQMNDLLRKHRDYFHMIATGDITHVNIGDYTFASGLANTMDLGHAGDVVTIDNMPKETKSWEEHLKDLDLVKERMDLLDENQKAQLSELKTITKVESRVMKSELDQFSDDDADHDNCAGEMDRAELDI